MTQPLLPRAETAAMLFWALLRSSCARSTHGKSLGAKLSDQIIDRAARSDGLLPPKIRQQIPTQVATGFPKAVCPPHLAQGHISNHK
jgi:hypothetical protein